ncbi:MAG: hypothetical protein A3K19_00580 [Lentisphaerae bacterium RIFOXYB12_FULL_65_16]|nr:MAG: hypothetical protein A3K18_14930 [Lentisphaerae bacterium RIFOXYA12_64_32]OGV86785.1 MAG: hypothetical protein A3K19_00580 [Lentisphaerae bacterium RIFOXYB12_FULL_65_16]
MLPGHSMLPQVWTRRKRISRRVMQTICRLLAHIMPGSPGIAVHYHADEIRLVLLPGQIRSMLAGPFYLYFGATAGQIGVIGGVVNSGDAELAAAALAPVTVAEGDQFVLTITYNGSGSDTAVITHIAAASVPTDWLTYTATADPAAGVCALKIVLGVCTAAGFTQRWTGGDIILPKGKTYTRNAIYNLTYSTVTYKLTFTYRSETFVNGFLYAVGNESTTDVFTASAECA